MRTRHVVVLIVAAAISGVPFSVVNGQEEPLPAAHSRDSEILLVALPLEPVVPEHQPTLADAVRANDYATFSSLYEQSGRPAAWRALNDLWSYAMTDPLGAFYGPEMYARYARAYGGYAAFIDEHRIVDNRGNAFYPTSETRAFLLAQAIRGTVAPSTVVAQSRPRFIKAENTAAPAESRETPAPKAAPTRVAAKSDTTPLPQMAKAAPAPVVAAKPAASPAAPATQVASVPQTAPVPQPAPVQAAAIAPAPAEPVVASAATPAEPSTVGRGLLLVIIGLIGVGLLALIVRAPREIPSVTPRQ